MKRIILIVRGTKQNQNMMKKSEKNRDNEVATELYTILKDLFITILGGLAVHYLIGLLLFWDTALNYDFTLNWVSFSCSAKFSALRHCNI